jgi:Hypoxia induced protein conserved region
MFRARILAQGFTLCAMVGGSIFWKDDRLKRKELEKALADKKAAEKREKWLKELDERDREDREWRARFEDVAARAKEAEEGAKPKVARTKAIKKVLRRPEEEEEVAKRKDVTEPVVGTAFQNKRVLEQVHDEGWGRGMWLVREAWRRR